MNVVNVDPWQFLAVCVLLLVLGGLLLWRLVNKQGNTLEWEDLVSTNGMLNAYKIGYWIGVGIGGWVVVEQTHMGKLDTGVFVGYLAYLGGVPVTMSAIRNRGDVSRSGRQLPQVPPPRDQGE